MLSSSYKVRGEEVARLKQTSIKVLILLFINTTVWLAGTFLFMHLEASNEAEHKCGVKKVQRNFIETLWQESRTSDELEWKSSARQKIMNFEDQIYEAVEAGVSSTSGQSPKLLYYQIENISSFSGQKVWSIPNTFVYVFTMSTTIGYGHLTPGNPNIRLISIAYAMVSIPLLSSLVSQLSSAVSSLLVITSLSLRPDTDHVSPHVSSSTLTLILTMVTMTGALMFSVLYQWDLETSVYFMFSSVSTVGFGDVIPGDSLMFLMVGGYILIGLAVFSLWQESFVVG